MEFSLWSRYKGIKIVCEQPLADWCLVAGIASTVLFVSQSIIDWKAAKDRAVTMNSSGQLPLGHGRNKPYFIWTWYCLNCVWSGIVVWGAVWVYSIDPSFHSCPPPLFDFVFYFITINLSLVPALVVLVCCAAIIFDRCVNVHS